MGVVEKQVQIVENTAPPPTSTDFSQSNAVLIEGYVFPAHKAKKATKLAKQMQSAGPALDTSQDVTTECAEDGEEFTSDEGSSSESSYVDDDSSSDDSDGNVDTFSAADLSPFAALWWKVSEMVTPTTLQLVATWHGHGNVNPVDAPIASSTDLDNRRLLFGTFCMKQMPSVIQACQKESDGRGQSPLLTNDRGVQMTMNDIVQTLHLRQPIEGTRVLEVGGLH
ncbi:hypothetical protein DYB32_007113 [Aphanomyces invadans]|uniref:Uncharacterized protein n=1 Tax=Aphanomyces invadans TaxID=157072 RepID=A0A418AT07_9STRA|nr:hypothetical protein DYB32_007113 [Aphanomyces invadans]